MLRTTRLAHLAALAAALLVAPAAQAASSTTATYSCNWPLSGEGPVAVQLSVDDGALAVAVDATGAALTFQNSLLKAASIEGDLRAEVTAQRSGATEHGSLEVRLGQAPITAGGATLTGSGAHSSDLDPGSLDGLTLTSLAFRFRSTKTDGSYLTGLSAAQIADPTDTDASTYDVSCVLAPGTQGPPALTGALSLAGALSPIVPGPPDPTPQPQHDPGTVIPDHDTYVCAVPGVGDSIGFVDTKFSPTLAVGATVGYPAIYVSFPGAKLPHTLALRGGDYGAVISTTISMLAVLTADSGKRYEFPMRGGDSFYTPPSELAWSVHPFMGSGRLPEAGTLTVEMQSLTVMLPPYTYDGTSYPGGLIECSPRGTVTQATVRVTDAPSTATPTPTPTSTPTAGAPRYAVTGTVGLRAANGLAAGTGSVTGAATLGAGGGQLTLAPVTVPLRAFGFLPVAATVAVGPLALTPASGAPGLTGRAVIHIPSLTLFGIRFAGSSACATRTPSTVSLSTATLPGAVSGRFSIGRLVHCGPLSDVASLLLAGSRHTLALTLS